MTVEFKKLTQDISSNLSELGKNIPQVMKEFNALNRAGSAEGVLDAKTKELIALAIGVAVRCDGCIGFHSKALVKLGASEAEVHEALGGSGVYGRWAVDDVCRQCGGSIQRI